MKPRCPGNDLRRNPALRPLHLDLHISAWSVVEPLELPMDSRYYFRSDMSITRAIFSTFEDCFDTVLHIWRAATNNLYQQFLLVQYPHLISGSEGQLPATAGLILAPHILGGAWKLKHQVRWDSWKMEFATTTTTTTTTTGTVLKKTYRSFRQRLTSLPKKSV